MASFVEQLSIFLLQDTGVDTVEQKAEVEKLMSRHKLFLSYKGFKGSCGVKEQQPHQEDCNDDPSINAHPPRVTRELERSSLRAAIHRQFNWYDNVHNFSLPGPQCNAIIVLWPFKLLNGCYENCFIIIPLDGQKSMSVDHPSPLWTGLWDGV